MTFKVNAPNAAQSPGVFPGQANDNWQRVLSNINSDHVFAFTNNAQQGMHRQCSFLTRATPTGSTAPASGILYSKNDTSGQPQLN